CTIGGRVWNEILPPLSVYQWLGRSC
ncbi:hypothetical protein GBAR_LOCUS31074, partial [Geodia barretti]